MYMYTVSCTNLFTGKIFSYISGVAYWQGHLENGLYVSLQKKNTSHDFLNPVTLFRQNWPGY